MPKTVTTKFWIGDHVKLDGDISAKVTGLTFHGDLVEYRCAYFIQGVYYVYWLHDYEIISAENPTPTVLKLRNGGQDANNEQ